MVVFKDPEFEGALIGVSTDERAVYDYDKMVDSLVQSGSFTQEEAEEWISYNTIRSLDYMDCKSSPVIVRKLEEGEYYG